MSAVAPGKHPCIISSGQKDPSLLRAMEAMEAFPEPSSGTLLTTRRRELGSHVSLTKLGKGKRVGDTLASGSQNLPMFKVNRVEGPCFLLPGKMGARVG